MIRDVEMDFLTDMESHEKKRLRSKCSSMQAFRREKRRSVSGSTAEATRFTSFVGVAS
jgi:hypothetical protein